MSIPITSIFRVNRVTDLAHKNRREEEEREKGIDRRVQEERRKPSMAV